MGAISSNNAHYYRYSKAVRNNRAIGVGSGRNARTSIPSTVETPVLFSAGADSASAIIVRQTSSKQQKGERSVIEYHATVNAAGEFRCPECERGFLSIDTLVEHLVDRTVARRYRPSVYNNQATIEAAAKIEEGRACVICHQTFAKSNGNKRQPIKRHIDRHFPHRYPCGGLCGNEGCTYIGSNTADISTHTSLINPQHECLSCEEKFGWSSQLKWHVEEKHVRDHQIIGFAATAGFDVLQLSNASPWMNGPSSDSICNVPISARLAKVAADAIVATRKPEPNRSITWTGVKRSTGGNNGSNKATACDTCRESGDRCIHRYSAEAPDEARNGPVKLIRCLNCKTKDWKCRHTHFPLPQCENCGTNCRRCTH